VAHDERPQDDEAGEAHARPRRQGGERLDEPVAREGGGRQHRQRRGGERHDPAAGGHQLELAKAAHLRRALESPPGGEVAGCRDREGDDVGAGGAEGPAEGEEEGQPGNRGGDADAGEAGGVGPEGPHVETRRRFAAGGVAPPVARGRGDPRTPGGELLARAPEALQVTHGRGEDVDARIRVVHPVDGDFVDPQPVALRHEQQLGVEEPVVVLDERQQNGHEGAA